MADVKLAEAVAAYDAELARTGVPAAAVFAAGVVLGLAPAEALNVLMAAGEVDLVSVRYPGRREQGVAFVRL